MTKKLPTIVFFGNERLSTGFEPDGAPTFERLLAAGYHVAAVVSNFEKARSRKQRKLEIAEVAKKHHIPLFLPQKVTDIKQELAAIHADLGVLIAYGKIIPESIINLFPKGIVNIHPSLLPLYRGPTPIEQAMLDGATETGVSLMKLVKAMDAGPVYAQNSLALKGNETKKELTQTLLALGGEMLLKHLPHIIDDTLEPVPQDETKATYCQLLDKDQSELNLALPAQLLERQVRAFADWPKSTITLFGSHKVIVRKAHVVRNQDDGNLVVACGSGTYLEIQQVTAPSGRTMSGADFVRGYKAK